MNRPLTSAQLRARNYEAAGALNASGSNRAVTRGAMQLKGSCATLPAQVGYRGSVSRRRSSGLSRKADGHGAGGFTPLSPTRTRSQTCELNPAVAADFASRAQLPSLSPLESQKIHEAAKPTPSSDGILNLNHY